MEAPDGRCTLVSFITSPLVIGRENVYVLFVTDAALAASAQSFEWSLTENAGTPIKQTTEHGEFSYTPQSLGALNLVVRVLGAGDIEQAQIATDQEVVSLNPTLEALITGAKNEPGPGVANPDVSRELVNDFNPYYQDVTLQTPEPGDAFKRFVFGMVFGGALHMTPVERKQHLDEMAASLNGTATNFGDLIAKGAGVSRIRLALLAMTLPQAPGSPTPIVAFTELPEPPALRALADEQMRQTVVALDEETRIDLFNLVRFPKSNITLCARILEALRDRYFSGTPFDDVLTGMSGTRAHWIVRHHQEGPLIRE